MNFPNLSKLVYFFIAAPRARVVPPSFLRRTLVFSLLFEGADARCSALALQGGRQVQALRQKLKRFEKFCENVHSVFLGAPTQGRASARGDL